MRVRDHRGGGSWFLASALGLLLLGTPAQGQELSINLLGGYERVLASKSAQAVFETTGGLAYGGEATFGLGDGLFIGAGVRTFSKTGERAFVANATSPAFRLGFPLKVRVTPVYALGGYRFGDEGSLLRPYVAGGLGAAFYRERSEIAGEVETADATKFSALAMAGLEFGKGSLRFGVDAAYIGVPDALGVGGVSAVYGEKDAGGFVLSGRVRWTLGR